MSDPHRALRIARQRLTRALTGPPGAGPPLVRTGAEPSAGRPGDAALAGAGLADAGLAGAGLADDAAPGEGGLAGSAAPGGGGLAGNAAPGGDRLPGGAAPTADPPGAGGAVTRLAAAAFDPGRPGLRALAAVALVVAIGAGVLAWWSRPQPEPVVPQLTTTDSAELPVPATSSPLTRLVVAVSGEVRRPGLVELPPGARVADAIEAAGGLLPDADVAHLNLARKVVDGELITVGIPPPPGAEPGGGPPGSAPGGKVNLNTATLAELETLPGIGPTLAQRIIDHRTVHGPFGSIDELREVSGIGEARFAELADRVTV